MIQETWTLWRFTDETIRTDGDSEQQQRNQLVGEEACILSINTALIFFNSELESIFDADFSYTKSEAKCHKRSSGYPLVQQQCVRGSALTLLELKLYFAQSTSHSTGTVP